MRKSLMLQGLSDKDVQAIVQRMNLNDYLYPTLFPLQFTPTLTFSTLSTLIGVPVAADVVAWNSTAPKKTRQVVDRIVGEIPKIEIARVLEETDINNYQQLLQYAKTTEGAQELVKAVYDDLDYAWKGVAARLEWLALNGLSNGKITLSQTTNATTVTETAVDLHIPTAQKVGTATEWDDHPTTATPIADIRAVVAQAKALGFKPAYALMDAATFEIMAACTEVVNYAASWINVATSTTRTPRLQDVNNALAADGLPTIKIIDSQVTIELLDGTQTVTDCWRSKVVAFLPSLTIGKTLHAPLADESVDGSAAMKIKRGHTLLKKFATEDPVTEVTKGLANAFPVLTANKQIILKDISATTWS